MSVLPEVLDDEAPTWRQRSACQGAPIDVFFPLGDDFRLDSSGYERACADCAGCPVQQECLEAHLNELHGCWGGSSPVERRDLRRQRGVQVGAWRWRDDARARGGL